MEWKINLPYPEVKVEKENIYYAQILLNIYAGAISEETAINQYIYDYLWENNQELAHDLKEISITEMHHLAILGKVLKKLGINPKLKYISKDGKLKNWDANFLSYLNNTNEMLKYNMILEEKTIKHYEDAYKKINDFYIRRLITRILLDEKKHLACFKYWLNKLTCR